MSTFKRVTKHPLTGAYEVATWMDDYFGEHVYGVAFLSDGKVWPTEIVDRNEPKNFWAEDTKIAFLKFIEDNGFLDDPENYLLQFLNNLQNAYNARWERDPILGEGATMEDAEEDEDDYLTD